MPSRHVSRVSGDRIRHRFAQGLTYLRPRRTDIVDARLNELLRTSEFNLIHRLSPADREHHLVVYDRLVRLGCADEDLLKAALLHDVGKVDGDVRVGLVHRTFAVLLSTISLSLLHTLSSPAGFRWRRGLYLTHAHPELGALLARDAGCSERTCWLIAHHQDEDPIDEGLQLLQRADDGQCI